MWAFNGNRRPDFAEPPGPGQESVWDFPRPPALTAPGRLVEVNDGTTVVAATRAALRVAETASPPTWYLPMADVHMGLLSQVQGSSMCEWKGAARYWALRSAPGEVVAWDYPDPKPAFAQLRDHLAFYPGRIQCLIDGHLVQPQPGGFYGGWITPDLVGPFKGEPGTGHW